MGPRSILDGQRGASPEIRTEGDTVIFRFDVAGMPKIAQLVIRCDGDGKVWAAITPIQTPEVSGRSR